MNNSWRTLRTTNDRDNDFSIVFISCVTWIISLRTLFRDSTGNLHVFLRGIRRSWLRFCRRLVEPGNSCLGNSRRRTSLPSLLHYDAQRGFADHAGKIADQIFPSLYLVLWYSFFNTARYHSSVVSRFFSSKIYTYAKQIVFSTLLRVEHRLVLKRENVRRIESIENYSHSFKDKHVCENEHVRMQLKGKTWKVFPLYVNIQKASQLEHIRIRWNERNVLQKERPTPVDWSSAICELLDRLLVVAPGARISTLKELKQVNAMRELDFDKVLNKRIKPSFTPPKDHLNCDPTFELEEMIIETKPLHKKKKRLAKQR